MQLDTLAGLLEGGFQVLAALLVIVLLHQWEPVLRRSLEQRPGSDSVWIRWLLPRAGSSLLRVPRAAGQVVVLSGMGLIEFVQGVATEGTSLAWLFNALNRYRLDADQTTHTFTPIEEDVRARIVEPDMPERHLVVREELAVVGQVLDEWQQTGLRGLVAMVGDRGTGKHTACHRIASEFTARGLDLRRAEFPGPMRTPTDLFHWLAGVVGCEGRADTQEEMVELLAEAEPRAVLLEGIHRTFARRVGGLRVVQALLYVLNASSNRHFYVVTVHGPAWDYFASVGSMVDCGVFHTVVDLAPFDSRQLRAITLARAGEAGLNVDFGGLDRQTAIAGDASVGQDQAAGVFYRLLAEASGGNPTAAVDLFSRCLEATDDPKRVRLRMGQALSLRPIAALSDDALFVLVALNLHDELEQQELVEVTNLSLATVRATVRDLVSRGLVEREKGHLLVPDHHRRAVQRTLRRRHFLHLGEER